MLLQWACHNVVFLILVGLFCAIVKLDEMKHFTSQKSPLFPHLLSLSLETLQTVRVSKRCLFLSSHSCWCALWLIMQLTDGTSHRRSTYHWKECIWLITDMAPSIKLSCERHKRQQLILVYVAIVPLHWLQRWFSVRPPSWPVGPCK